MPARVPKSFWIKDREIQRNYFFIDVTVNDLIPY